VPAKQKWEKNTPKKARQPAPAETAFRIAPPSASFGVRERARERTMQPYRNLAGNSGVAAFDILRDGIIVRFVNGGIYLYDEHTPGREYVEEMKRLARLGRGLSSYISRSNMQYAERVA
jgi:hypothetical protein